MKRILICDDDKEVLEIVTFLLTNVGWEVVTSFDCNHIIEKILEHNPSVIVMDYAIPDEGGLITTQILKKHPESRHIPVVFFSSDPDIAILAKTAGADFYLAKPFNIDSLENIIHQAHEKYLSGDQSGLQTETA